MNGFFKLIQGSNGYDRIVSKPDEVFILRFHFILETDATLLRNFIYSNKKALVMKCWSLSWPTSKEIVAWSPIQASLPNSDFKFQSKEGLNKNTTLLDYPLATNKALQIKSLTHYAGVLIDLNINE